MQFSSCAGGRRKPALRLDFVFLLQTASTPRGHLHPGKGSERNFPTAGRAPSARRAPPTVDFVAGVPYALSSPPRMPSAWSASRARFSRAPRLWDTCASWSSAGRWTSRRTTTWCFTPAFRGRRRELSQLRVDGVPLAGRSRSFERAEVRLGGRFARGIRRTSTTSCISSGPLARSPLFGKEPDGHLESTSWPTRPPTRRLRTLFFGSSLPGLLLPSRRGLIWAPTPTRCSSSTATCRECGRRRVAAQRSGLAVTNRRAFSEAYGGHGSRSVSTRPAPTSPLHLLALHHHFLILDEPISARATSFPHGAGALNLRPAPPVRDPAARAADPP